MANHNNNQGDHASFGHPAPTKLLYGIFIALVSLTILTIVANGWPLGNFDIWVAMIIATIKASLVGLFFMHLYWEKAFNIISFLSSIFFLTLFISLTLIDRGAYRKSMEDFPIVSRPDQSDYVAPPTAPSE